MTMRLDLRCKGCYTLGSACGECQRCVEEIAELYAHGKIEKATHGAAVAWGRGVRGRNEKLDPPASEIPLITIPAGTECQEASVLSVLRYIPCSAAAEAIVYHDRDRRGYFMCAACAYHNVMNRGGRWVTGTKATEYLRERGSR